MVDERISTKAISQQALLHLPSWRTESLLFSLTQGLKASAGLFPAPLISYFFVQLRNKA